MRIICVGLILSLALLIAGCSGGQVDKEQTGRFPLRTVETPALEYHAPDIGPDVSNMKEVFKWTSITMRQMSCLTAGLTWYKFVKDKWPESWADLLNGYILFLPADPITNEQLPLLTLNELKGSVEAGAIVADPRSDGWHIYQARINKEGQYVATDVWNPQKAGLALEKKQMYPEESRMENFILTVKVWAMGQITGCLVYTASLEEAPRMPGSYEELTQGLIRNPSTTLGYTPTQDGVGTFKVGVKPDVYQWAFVFNEGREIFEIRQLEVTPTGAVKNAKLLYPGDEAYDPEGFKWILTHEDFMN